MMAKGGGADADQIKVYDKPPDPVVKRVEAKGQAALSSAQLRERGNNFMARRLHDDALQLFTQAIATQGEKPHVDYAARAAAYATLNRWEESLYDARKAVTLNRDYAKGYVLLGTAMMKLKQSEEALYAFERGLKRNPSNNALKDGSQQARRAAKDTLAESFDDAETRGDEASSSENYTAALKWYSQAMSIFDADDSSVAGVCVKRAEIWKTIGDARSVVADCDEAIALGSTALKAFLMRGAALEELARYTEALADFKRALEIEPTCQGATESIRLIEKMIQHQKEERKAEKMEDVVKREQAMADLKAKEAEQLAIMRKKLAVPSHMDPDRLQYFTRHYGYW